MRPTRTLIALLAAVLTLGACGGGDDDTSASTTDRDATMSTTTAAADSEDTGGGETAVTIKVFNFQPDPMEIGVGDTVTWTNGDEILHTVTSGTREQPDGTFDGQLPEKGTTFEFTFDEAGTYEYFCSRHPGEGMTAKVVVT